MWPDPRLANHVYPVTSSMEDEYFYSADSELLVIPQVDRLRFYTELGVIDLEPKEIAIQPCGMVYRVALIDGPAWGVRIAVNQKGIAYQKVPGHLVNDDGQLHPAGYVAPSPENQRDAEPRRNLSWLC